MGKPMLCARAINGWPEQRSLLCYYSQRWRGVFQKADDSALELSIL